MSCLSEGPEPKHDGPLAGLAVYTLFGGDPAQLLQWCNFHLNQGADRLYVGLDRPTPDMLGCLPNHPRVQWLVFDQGTWDAFYSSEGQNVERKQVDGFRLAAREAARQGYAYLAFVDADELIRLERPFADLTTRFPGAPVLRLEVREMWFDEEGDVGQPFGATVAVGCTGKDMADWTGSLGWRAQFLRDGWVAHNAGKSIYRLPLVGGDISVHAPLSASAASRAVAVPVDSGAVLHFDCGSVSTWNAKWGGRLDGRTVATGLGRHRRAQFTLFARELRRGPEEQEAFFRDFFTLGRDIQERLTAGATAERVQLQDQLDRPLPVDSLGTGLTVRLKVHPAGEGRADVQFALLCDRASLNPCFATMSSVLAHLTRDSATVRFVVLGDGLENADVARLLSLEHARIGVEVHIHDITADLDRDTANSEARRDFGRLYLVDHLPEQRTVYLSSDVLATRDVTELFDLDLGDACLAGAPEDPAAAPDGPLDAAVLLLDLDAREFRVSALRARALGVLVGDTMERPAHEAIARAFAGRTYRLPAVYNHRVQTDPYAPAGRADGCEDRAAALLNFSEPPRPWEAEATEPSRARYRELVVAAEQQLQVDCCFGFSTPAPPARRCWSADRWAQTFQARSARPSGRPALATDTELIDVCDSGAYLRLWPAMYRLAVSADLRLTALVGEQSLFEIPLSRLGPQRTDLVGRVGQQVRKLAFDLGAALEVSGGVATGVHVALTGPDRNAHNGYARHLGVLDVLAAGHAARPELLPSQGFDGAVESVAKGWLTGWCWSGSAGRTDPVSLYFGDELVARRPAVVPRLDLAADGSIRGFRFNLAGLAALGYVGDISVRLSGSNIPLRGARLPFGDAVTGDLRYEPEHDAWLKAPGDRRTAVKALIGRLSRRR